MGHHVKQILCVKYTVPTIFKPGMQQASSYLGDYALTNHYGTHGFLQKVGDSNGKDIWRGKEDNPHGQFTKELYGNGIEISQALPTWNFIPLPPQQNRKTGHVFLYLHKRKREK